MQWHFVQFQYEIVTVAAVPKPSTSSLYHLNATNDQHKTALYTKTNLQVTVSVMTKLAHLVEKWKILTHNAAKVEVVIDFNQFVKFILVQDDKLVERRTHFACTVQTMNNVLLVLFQHKQNAEYFHLTCPHRTEQMVTRHGLEQFLQVKYTLTV